MYPGDTLICDDAEANPSPDITWTWDNVTVDRTVYGNPFTVNESMIGYEYDIKCEASNEVNGVIYTGEYTLSSISVKGNFSFMRLTYVTRSGKMWHFDKRALEAKIHDLDLTLFNFYISFNFHMITFES